MEDRRFLWGAATAAYQIEGAYLEDGKGLNIWDEFCKIPGKVHNGDTGEIACDHYHKFKEDIGLMKELGINSYRFSIGWARVMPEGRGKLNQKGMDFYKKLIEELLKNDIEPIITLYHWDLPQSLQKTGGWANRETVDYFVEYAQAMFKSFGGSVNKWITHNEPWVAAFAGHRQGRHAPGITDLPTAVQVSHHLILSHAKTVQAFRSSCKKDDDIGITLNLYPVHPASDLQEDAETARIVDGYHNRWFLDPIFKGAYPEDILDIYNKAGAAPVVQTGDMHVIAGNPGDFLGVNYYFRKVVKRSDADPVLGFEEVKPAGRPYTAFNWEVYQEGMHELLLRLKNKYDDHRIFVTENGAAYADDVVSGGIIQDDDRVEYLKNHIAAMLQAKKDGCRVEGYYAWSLLDNFEWAWGYSKRFGLFHVDYKTQQRLWKKSSLWYKEFLKNIK